jgi:hypothetical protein
LPFQSLRLLGYSLLIVGTSRGLAGSTNAVDATEALGDGAEIAEVALWSGAFDTDADADACADGAEAAADGVDVDSDLHLGTKVSCCVIYVEDKNVLGVSHCQRAPDTSAYCCNRYDQDNPKQNAKVSSSYTKNCPLLWCLR